MRAFRQLLIFAIVVVVKFLFIKEASAQPATLRADAWMTDGAVFDIAQGDGVTYIGGQFNHVLMNTGNGAALSMRTAIPIPLSRVGFVSSTSTAIGTILAVIPDGAGGWYVGGSFNRVDDFVRTNLVHILANGALDLAWRPDPNARVHALALRGNAVYVGGDFTQIGGQTRNNIAAVDASTGLATPWNPNATITSGSTTTATGAGVRALVVDGQIIYAGGNFTNIGGATRNRIAALDSATGDATAWNPDAGGTVRALAISGATIYAGGSFTTISGVTRNRLAAIDAVTGIATPWNPSVEGLPPGASTSLSSAINTIDLAGTLVYVGGLFGTVGGRPRINLAAIEAATGISTSWNPRATGLASTGGQVFALAINGSEVFVGGRFTAIGTEPQKFVAAIDIASGVALPWNPNFSALIPPAVSTSDTAHVYALAMSGLTIYAGGSLRTSGLARSNIAAFNTLTGRPTEWNPNADEAVFALTVSGATVYAGGSFTMIDDAFRNGIAALDAATGNATAWNPNCTGEVNTIDVTETTVYVGGLFSMIGGLTRGNMAAIDVGTGKPTTWNPSANGSVRVLAVRGAVAYVAGDFTTINGRTRNRLAALDLNTGALTAWDPSPDGSEVHALTLNGSLVYAGGDFTTVGGLPRNFIAAIDSASGAPTLWNPEVSGSLVSAIMVNDSIVYLGGEFTNVGSETRNNLAAVSAETALAMTWNPNPTGGAPPIMTLETDGATIFAGGNFTSITSLSHSFFAPLGETPLNPDPTVTAVSPRSGTRLQTFDVTFIGTNFSGEVTSVNVGSGIAVNSITVNSATELTANITIAAHASTGVRNFSVSNNPPGGGTSSFFPFMINNPAPAATNLIPAAGLRGQRFDVTINGANFISGVTTTSFGADIAVNSMVVTGPTLLTANITIGPNAVVGKRDVVVTNAFPGGGTAKLTGVFSVGYPVPALTSLTPDNGARLETLDVVFTGTGFVEGITTVKVGAGITVNSIAVTSATSLTANLTIAGNAATGARTFALINAGPGGGASENKNFTVNNPAPILTRLYPESAGRGQTHDIVLIGANFFRNATTVSFGPDITVNFVTVNSDTQITANLAIPLRVENGNRDVHVINAIPGGGTATLSEGFAVVNPRPTLISIVPMIGALNQTLNVNLTGMNFIDGITSVDFGEGIAVNYITVASSTKIIANITIENSAPAEPHDVSVGNAEPGGGGVTLPKAFNVSSGTIVRFSVPDDIPGARGDTVAIPLNLNPSSRKVGSFDATLHFNPAVLAYADFTSGPILSEDWQIDVHTDSASVNIGAFTTNNSLTQSGTAIVLLFRVHETATLGTTVPLVLSDLSATNNNASPLPTEGHDGLLTVAEATINGNLYYYIDEKPIAGDTVQVEIDDPVTMFDISNADGYFAITGIPFGSDVVLTPRRIAGNFPTGIITAGDALRAFKGRTDGPDPLNGYQSLAMDVNGDCQLTSGDALAILMRATGKLQGFYRYEEDERAIRLDDWRFVDYDFNITTDNWCEAPDNRSYSPLDEDKTDQYFIGVIRGDVNGSFSAPLAKSAGNDPIVTLSNPGLIGNEQFNFTAEVNAADKVYNSFDVMLTYDAAAIRIVQVSFAKTLAPENWQIVWNAGQPGILRIAGFSMNEAAIKGKNALFVIEAALAHPAKENDRLDLKMPLALFGWNGKEVAAQNASGDLKFVASLPQQYALEQNYPNPFAPRQARGLRAATTIKYALPEAGVVHLRIYDMLGNVVRTLISKSQNAGTHTVGWNGRKDDGSFAVSGLYFYRLEAGTFVKTNKLILQK